MLKVVYFVNLCFQTKIYVDTFVNVCYNIIKGGDIMAKKKLPVNPIVGERVEKLRKEKGMTQEELAKKLGYKSKSSVTHIENGRDVPRQMVAALSEILETNPAYLMGWSDNSEPLTDTQARLAELVRDTHPDGVPPVVTMLTGIKKEVPDRAENPKIKRCMDILSKMTDAELVEIYKYLDYLIWKRDHPSSGD